MAVKFEFYESPNTIGTRKKRYHARVVNRERISTDHLAQEIHHSSSLTVADIKATIIALSEKLAYHLKDGARVHIEGIGYFHISLTCPETRQRRCPASIACSGSVGVLSVWSGTIVMLRFVPHRFLIKPALPRTNVRGRP